jgi:hypothetical protein
MKIKIDNQTTGELKRDGQNVVFAIGGIMYLPDDIAPVRGAFGMEINCADLVRSCVPWWDDPGDGRFDIADEFLGRRQPRPNDPPCRGGYSE